MKRSRRRTFFKRFRRARLITKIFDLVLLALLAAAVVMIVIYKDDILGQPRDSEPFFQGKH